MLNSIDTPIIMLYLQYSNQMYLLVYERCLIYTVDCMQTDFVLIDIKTVRSSTDKGVLSGLLNKYCCINVLHHNWFTNHSARRKSSNVRGRQPNPQVREFGSKSRSSNCLTRGPLCMAPQPCLSLPCLLLPKAYTLCIFHLS